MIALEVRDQFVDADSRRDGERADGVVAVVPDKVGQREIPSAVRLLLLSQGVNRGFFVEQVDIVAARACAPDSECGARAKEALLDDLVEQFSRVVIQFASAGLVDDLRKSSAQLPCGEER